jgi:hypothetical protein
MDRILHFIAQAIWGASAAGTFAVIAYGLCFIAAEALRYWRAERNFRRFTESEKKIVRNVGRHGLLY